MLTGLDSHVFVVLFGVGIGYATIKFRYVQIAKILKWLSLVLFAYVLTAFTIGPDWQTVLHDTFVPTWPTGHEGWASLVAILGTTISPYLFFWQSSQEVEEKKAKGLRTMSARTGASTQDLHDRKLDVGVGTFVSNLVMYFIVLTCALTLHANGQKDIETTRQAAEALRPLAGWFAATLYTVGLVGVDWRFRRWSAPPPTRLQRPLGGGRGWMSPTVRRDRSMRSLSSQPLRRSG